VQLPEDVLSFLTMFTVRARSYPKVKRIVLYGSYAQNCWNQESDIDIAVFINKGDEEDIREVYKQLSALCYDYPLDVQVQVFFESELQEPMGIVEEIASYGIDITDLS